MNPKIESTQNLILTAAKEIFIAKGLEGARMQEIADLAGINKSLLHYYFTSKEVLFEAVFSEIASKLFTALQQIMVAELGFKEKVSFVIKIYLKGIGENPFIPGFVINTLNNDPKRFLKYIEKAGFNPKMLQFQINEEAALGKIRLVKAEHLMVNIISMCIFPYIARPILQNVFELDNSQYEIYLAARESEIQELVLKSIAI